MAAVLRAQAIARAFALILEYAPLYRVSA